MIAQKAEVHPEHSYTFVRGSIADRELINGQEKVVLDFTGVNVVSNSFADECIAKLLLDMSLVELKRRTTFRGLNPLVNKAQQSFEEGRCLNQEMFRKRFAKWL